MIRGGCPTPKKGRYDDLALAESIMLQVKYNRGLDVEVYGCNDHYHLRDKSKRRKKGRDRNQERKLRRKSFHQLTIFDWMKELNGT